MKREAQQYLSFNSVVAGVFVNITKIQDVIELEFTKEDKKVIFGHICTVEGNSQVVYACYVNNRKVCSSSMLVPNNISAGIISAITNDFMDNIQAGNNSF